MKMQSVALLKKTAHWTSFSLLLILLAHSSFCQSLTIGDSGYFEKPGVNVFVFNGQYNGMFYDEKTASGFSKRFGNMLKMSAALQLYITTRDEKYATVFKNAVWQSLDRSLSFGIMPALQAAPYMDEDYKKKLRTYLVKYKAICDDYAKQNPYGVPIATGGWGGSGGVVNFATANYYANQLFPDVISAEYVYKGLNYIFGCHPYSNISFVSSVGTVSKKVTYGNNRANFSFIAGGIVHGILVLKPDFPENKEDWPFFRGENEVTVGGCADYIFLANAAEQIADKK